MRSAASWLALAAFIGAAFVGYRLTAQSFAWIDKPNFGQPVKAATPHGAPAKPAAPLVPPVDVNAFKNQIPPAVMAQLQHLSPQQLQCLIQAIGAGHVQDALQGRLTSQEITAASACFK